MLDTRRLKRDSRRMQMIFIQVDAIVVSQSSCIICLSKHGHDTLKTKPTCIGIITYIKEQGAEHRKLKKGGHRVKVKDEEGPEGSNTVQVNSK